MRKVCETNHAVSHSVLLRHSFFTFKFEEHLEYEKEITIWPSADHRVEMEQLAEKNLD